MRQHTSWLCWLAALAIAANAVAGSFAGDERCCCASEQAGVIAADDSCCPAADADAPEPNDENRRGNHHCKCVLACSCLVKAPLTTLGDESTPLLPPVVLLDGPGRNADADAAAYTSRLKRPPKAAVSL